MCGIVGFAGSKADAASADVLTRMTDALQHRGPDGAGYHIDAASGVHLGHRRLAILDIEGGIQPMFNEDGQIAIVFNGEIYNHAELRRELLAHGHRFATDHSDTEVLVHGYEQWGEGLLPRLNGMFAFAIHDKRQNRLFLARDRFGEKPLHYWHRPGMFAFASEMKALRAHPGFNEPLNPVSLHKYFAYGYVPSPHSLWQNCFKLPGGSFLVHDLETGRVTSKSYWQFELQPDAALNARPEAELAEELRALFQQAVTRRMISDVPLGVFLSGGIDSSAALACASIARSGQPLDSFTIGFNEPSYDESGFARQMAGHVRSRHHEDILSIDALRNVMEETLACLDEPIADPSIVPTFVLSRFARSHVKVALSGDGGDELFAGYDPFKALAPAQAYQRFVPGVMHSALRGAAGMLPRSRSNMSLDFKLRRTLAGLSYSQNLWNPVWLSPVEPRDLPDLFSQRIEAEEVYDDAITLWNANPKLSLQEQTLAFYTRFYLQDNILVKVDRAAMASSLESRAVFLDNDLVDFCAKLPFALKFRNGTGKYLLRKALVGLVPENLLHRRKKGFGIPVADWLRHVPQTVPMAPLGDANLDWAAAQWAQHRAGHADHRLFLWSWLAAQKAALPAE